jgi:hypothetical protein
MKERRCAMSKCKAVLDSEKITEIRVKTKAQEASQKDKPKSKDSDKFGRGSRATQQSK